jgi:hypothetical protein
VTPVPLLPPAALQEQTDVHVPETTVHEALVFSAQLRLPSNTPTPTLNSFVEEVGAWPCPGPSLLLAWPSPAPAW